MEKVDRRMHPRREEVKREEARRRVGLVMEKDNEKMKEFKEKRLNEEKIRRLLVEDTFRRRKITYNLIDILGLRVSIFYLISFRIEFDQKEEKELRKLQQKYIKILTSWR